MKRRQFVARTCALVGACGFTGCGHLAVEPASALPQEVRIDLNAPQHQPLSQPDGWQVVGQLLLINHRQLGWLAFDRWCTHSAGSLAFVANPFNCLVCPVHYSEFNLDGSVRQGPARRALRQYRAEKKDNWLIIKI
jgi:Rieske Fe-S protein